MTFQDLLLSWCCAIFQAGISVVISLILALPLTYFLSQYNFFGKNFLLSLLAFFCIMPTKLCALAIKLFYGWHGFPGIISAHVLLNFPFACYLLDAAYQKIDWIVVWAAADLGASVKQQYKDAILPQLKPALLLASLSVFLLCFSSFSIPRMLGTDIYHYTPDLFLLFNKDKTMGWFCFLLRLLVMVPLGFLYNYLLHQKAYLLPTHIPYKKEILSFNFQKRLWLCYLIFIVLLLGGPLIFLLVNALEYDTPSLLYNNFWAKDPLLKVSINTVLQRSLLIAAISSLGSLVVGSLFASLQLFVSLRYARLLMHTIILLPLFIGNVATGILNSGLIQVPFITITISHIMLNYSFVYRFIIIQLSAYPRQLIQLAQSSGALPYQVFYTTLLPFMRTALVKAWLIAFGLSLVEVGASSVIAKNLPLTISLAMRLYYEHGRLDGFFGLGFILLFIVCIISLVVDNYD